LSILAILELFVLELRAGTGQRDVIGPHNWIKVFDDDIKYMYVITTCNWCNCDCVVAVVATRRE